MKALVAFGVLAVLLLVAGLSLGNTAADRPLTVDANDWIAINEKLGFVVVPSKGSSIARSNPAHVIDATASGYFMARTDSGWRRLVQVPPPVSVVPLQH